MLLFFHPRRDRWKDLMMAKTSIYVYREALKDENISGIVFWKNYS